MYRPAPLPRLLATTALCAVLAAAPFSGTLAQQAAPNRAATEQIVREYLMAHPEVLVESLSTYQEKLEAQQAEAQRQALATRQNEMFKNPASPVAGNPQGDVTLVEFFDYQCGYCKAVHADVRRLLESDGNARLVLQEFPILGPASLTASRAALAARKQDKYDALHSALMENRGQLDDDQIMRIAGSVGLDMERLKKDMQAPDIQDALQRNLQLAARCRAYP
jgi:protein-disulfide isomerase